MPNNLDPQVQSSLINGIFGALFGGGGVGFWGWLRGRSRNSADARCERVCANMVAVMEAMLAAMEALGTTHPGLTPMIVKVRVQIDHAKEYLSGDQA